MLKLDEIEKVMEIPYKFWSKSICVKDLFVDFHKKYKKPNKQNTRKIFVEGFKTIMLDVIENNTIFVFPVGFSSYAEIYIEEISGEHFNKWYKAYGYKLIDYIITEFKTYRPVIHIHEGKMDYTKRIDLGGEPKRLLYKLINEGKKYD